MNAPSAVKAAETQRGVLRADLQRYLSRMSGGRLRKFIECARTPGVQATVVLRFGQWSRRRALPVRLISDPLYLVLNFLILTLWGIDIPRGARIGPGLYIGHYGGIIVSSAAVIGRNCNLSQSITIGVSGAGDRRGAPVIGENVYIAPGARLFGRIRIGDNVKIGANAVIHKDLPDNAIAVLDPGFSILSLAGNQSPDETL